MRSEAYLRVARAMTTGEWGGVSEADLKTVDYDRATGEFLDWLAKRKLGSPVRAEEAVKCHDVDIIGGTVVAAGKLPQNGGTRVTIDTNLLLELFEGDAVYIRRISQT